MPFTAALSEHPSTVEAVAEVVGDVLERVGHHPDLAVLFVTAAHAAQLDQVAATVRAALAPGTLIGTTASSVLAGRREVEEHPAIALWAGTPGPVHPVRFDPVGRRTGGLPLAGLGTAEPSERGRTGAVDPGPTSGDQGLVEHLRSATTLVLLADPLSFPVDDMIDALAETAPGLQVIGGLASAGLAPGANRLVLDGDVHLDGAVGVLLGADQPVTTVVSQGCRPIGEPFVVTRSAGDVVHELGGVPPLARLDALFLALGDDDRALVRQGLHVGRVIDEHKPTFTRGDFLVRNVVGADRDTGAISIGDAVPVGATVQFHVRDAASAEEDLRWLLTGVEGDGALVFTCNGRGTRLFGRPDHDAEAVADHVRGAVGGMFCAGEIGPVGTRSFVHGFTASVAIFHDRR